jgi:thioredoxin reductase (NADPH)
MYVHLTFQLVENFPGFPDGVRGPEMMDKFRAQSIRFGTKIITETISKIDLSERPFKYWREGEEGEPPETTETVIIATGASAKRMGLKGEDTYWQSGISACAVCDGAVPIFRCLRWSILGYPFIETGADRNRLLLLVVGIQPLRKLLVSLVRLYGPSITKATLRTDLTKYGSHVYVLVRRDELRASAIMAKRLKANPKVVRDQLAHPLLAYSWSHDRPFCGIPWQLNVWVMAICSIAYGSRTSRPGRKRFCQLVDYSTQLVGLEPLP